MAYMKTTTYTSGVNILASEVGLVLKTFEGTQAMATRVDDKKIIKAGTVVPANNSSAKGIVFEDVDITDDEKKPISVIIAGRVIKENLPVTVDSGAETALKANGIYFD
jgi:hypothetical protein